MIELVGDFWQESRDHKYDALVCTTNLIVRKDGCLVMGAGIAKGFRDTFNNIDRRWGERLLNGQHQDGFMITSAYFSYNGNRLLHLVAFPTKENWKQDAKIELIERSALTLSQSARILGLRAVLMTRPGCANGHLNWPDVKPILDKYLDGRFYVIEREKYV